MNAIPPRGACPDLFAPMVSGDGLLVRLRPPGGALPATAARRLADAAARHGNGVIDLTQRGALQVRGLSADTLAPFAAAMIAAGLADPDPAVERRRAVIHPPLGDADPDASPHAGVVARAIEARLSRDPRHTDLPAKFCVAVDGGGALPLGDVGADIAVICGPATCRIAPAGADIAVRCRPTEAEGVVAALAAAFTRVAHAMPARRMRTVIQAVGPETVFAAAGLVPDAPFAPAPARDPIGWIGLGARGAVGLGVAFGSCDALALAALAGLAERFGDAMVRITPWRAVMLAGIPPEDANALRRAGAALGLIVAADDPRRRITACPGAPACASASVATRADAAALARPGLPPVHLSGCAKGCAHPAPAAITLVGNAGRYDLVRDGRAGDAPCATGLTIAHVAALRRGEATAR